jgi:hypothetical protein
MQSNEKLKIRLTQEQETTPDPAFYPKQSRAATHPIFFDQKTLDILDQIEYDFSSLKTFRKTTINGCMRASKLYDYTIVF